VTFRITSREFRSLGLESENSSSGPLHQSDKKSGQVKAYDDAVETLRHIQGLVPGHFFAGDVGLSIEVVGRTTADLDNIFKAVADGLQGLVYKNDRQIREGKFIHRG